MLILTPDCSSARVDMEAIGGGRAATGSYGMAQLNEVYIDCIFCCRSRFSCVIPYLMELGCERAPAPQRRSKGNRNTCQIGRPILH